jgi:hypothetical protein
MLLIKDYVIMVVVKEEDQLQYILKHGIQILKIFYN